MPNRAVIPTIRDRLLVPNHGDTLTIGKREAQQKVDRKEANRLPWGRLTVADRRWARLRRMAWILETAVEIHRHTQEFQEIVLLTDGHETEPPQQHQLPLVLH